MFWSKILFCFILIPDLIEERVATKWQRNEKVISRVWFRTQKKSLLMLIGFFDEKSYIKIFFGFHLV
jgi:hypothetical protein